MSYSKVIPLGDKGSITIGEAGGNAKLDLAAALAAGGGDLAGFAKVSVAVGVELEGQQLIDAGFGVIESKFAASPTVLGALKGLQLLIDAELPKV